VQPRATCSENETSFAYFWVGLGSNVNLEQIGTASICLNGNPEYLAWWQLVGRSEAEGGQEVQVFMRDSPECTSALTSEIEELFARDCPLPVEPGDRISAEVSFVGNDSFSLILENTTQNWRRETTQIFTGAERETAFWIAEAPRGELTHFATGDDPVVNFSNSSVDEVSITSGSPITFKVVMLSLPFFLPIRAEPSDLTSGDTAFSVTWKHH
jgi:hypothetical protein